MPSSPPPCPIDFLTHLISLTLSEQSSEALESSLLLSNTPLQILVKNGLALTNLSLTNNNGGISIGLGGKTLVELSRNSATTGTGGGGGLGSLGGHHDFRSGDLVKIRNYNSSSNSSSNKKGTKNGNNRKGKDKVGVEEGMGQEIEAVVYKVLNDKITLVLNDHKSRVSKYIEPESEGGGIDEFEWTDKITLFKVSNPSTFKRQIHFLRQAINAFEAVNPHQDQDQDQEEEDEENESDSSSSTDQESTPTPTPTTPSPNQSISPLLSVLLGLTPPTLSPPPSSNSSSSLKYFDESLNDSQKEAIEFCLNGTRELGLIWGPPGTGKTQTLIEIIKQLILVENKKVLVCGASNLSVDNILSRLTNNTTSNSKEGEGEKIELTRLGHPARILNELNKHTLDSQSCMNDQTFLVKDIQSELLQLTKELSNRDKKTRLRGSDRKLKWELIKNLKKDMKKRLSSVEKQVLKNKKLVFSTTHGAGSKVLDKMILENGSKFDVVIIDEAAQATEPSCWIPIMRGEKLILAGDHLQLPPTIKSISSSSSSSSSSTIIGPSPLRLSKTLETTLFSRLLSLHGESIRKMLKIQYRFNEKINEFPSKMLYDNELKPSDLGGISERRLGDLLQQQQQDEEDEVEIGEGDLQDLNEPIVFFDTAGLGMYERGGEPGQFGSESKSNENEADIVLNYVKFLIESKIPPSSISIISPYSSQVSLISSSISSSLELETTTTTTTKTISSSSLKELKELIQIGSIDSNQGRENDVVIISLVRSNEIGEIGFLKEFKRLNVAMTRARRQLVVVGDSETLKKGGDSLVTTTTTSKKKEKKEGGGGNDEKSNSNSNSEKEIIENDSIDERDDDDDDDGSIGGSSGGVEELEQEETPKSTRSSTKGETRKGDKKKKQKKKVTGASYLKEWIEWLEENAYVRVP